MMTHYLQLKEQYKDCIIFYRLGDFYEMFFEDAQTASKELDLTLTGRDCGLPERAPMCGVPHHAYETYAARLVEKGYKVAICEQLTEPSKDKKIVDRDIIRIITAGTVTESSMLDENKSNYIMCIHKSKNKIAYCYADITTGEFFCGESETENLLDYLNDQIVRVMPAQIICNSEVYELVAQLPTQQYKTVRFEEYYAWAFQKTNAEKIILEQYSLSSLKGYDFNTANISLCVGAMLNYLKETQKRSLNHLKIPKLLSDKQFMYIDTNTRRNLEIEETLRERNKVGSLLWVLDKTCTSAGKRMLRNWLAQPLQSSQEIKLRLHLVEQLTKNSAVRMSLQLELSKIQDIERLVGKISYGNIMPRDCLALSSSIKLAPKIKSIICSLNDEYFNDLVSKITDMSEFCAVIDSTIKLDSPLVLKDGNYINDGINKDLDYYRNISVNAKNFIAEVEAREREKTGIKNLKIAYNRVFGYYIEINKSNADKVPFDYIRKQTISNSERYITEELKKFEEDILSSTDKAIRLEAEIFATLREYLMKYCSELQKIASTFATIDTLSSLASVAVNNNYCKPAINTNNDIKVVNGRHPVVEIMLSNDNFIGNDTYLNDKDDRTIILTGPNMAGKSTYMRQIALITIMAHIGSFVPADSADICIVDRIFTRIGASDDLSVGQSTFMVEMVEVSNILQYATNKSLIILDEVGRGTSTFDGLSIAWAVVEYLASHLSVKTLFATHFHELTQLEGKVEGVKNYNIAIKDIDGHLVFLRKIMRGGAQKSFGIEVASLAGLPENIIKRAKNIISVLEKKEMSTIDTVKKPQKIKTNIERIVDDLDMDKISPMLAFETLLQMKSLVEKEKE